MSDDQENVTEMTGSFLTSQTAKELEIQLHQLKGELVSLMASYKILFTGPIQSRGFDDKDDLIDEKEKALSLVKKVTPVKKELRLKKLLRRKLITCYDLGPVMEPSDVFKGEKLSRKDLPSEVKFKADISRRREEIFPFAVPYFRLPLFPSSRNEPLNVSQVLTTCRMFPRQLQSFTKEEQDMKAVDSTQEKIFGDIKDETKSSSQERDRATLQDIVPVNG